MSDSYPNGNQPVTQVTRDQMAQNDHDKLVELSVMMQNIMAAQLRLEQQIKDLIQGQVTALASWEVSSKAVHDTQDARIRKIEDLALQYVPVAQELTSRVKSLEDDTKILQDNKTEVLGGWKTILFMGGSVAGVLSVVYVIVQLLGHCIAACSR